jgi:hypothetical protein
MQRNQRIVQASQEELPEAELLDGTGFESEDPDREFESAQDEAETPESEEAA